MPLPTAPGDHQTKNAEALTQTGGAVLVPDAQLDGAKVVSLINELLGDHAKLREMSERAGEQARPHAASDIADLIEMHARA